MYPDPEENWRQIAEEFKRRRTRELVATVPLIASILVVVQLLHDSTFELGGLGGLPLLATALAVTAGYFVHHLANWRCPYCRHYLGKLGVSMCASCGAVFTAPKDQPLMDDAAARRESERRAVQAEVGQYRNKTGLALLKGLMVVVVGGVMILLAKSPDALQPDSVLIRRFGEGGAHLALQLFAGFVVMVGLAVIGYALWRHGPGARRYASQLQGLVDARAGNGAPPVEPANPGNPPNPAMIAPGPWHRR
jgi:uncharacterized membrane protein YidH (DUF202 family)